MVRRGTQWVKPGIWEAHHEPYWPQQCLRLHNMVRRNEPVHRIIAMCEWMAAGYAKRPAHNDIAAEHNREMVDLLTGMAARYRREKPAQAQASDGEPA